MTRFEPDGLYNSIPYRVLPDQSIEAMTPRGFVRFKNMAQLLVWSASVTSDAHASQTHTNVPASVRPVDFYSILLDAIKTTEQNSAQLRALVYERARFNLKREVLFGYSSVDLADTVRKIDEFERAVARIEANAVDEVPGPYLHDQSRLSNPTASNELVQILPPEPVAPLYAGLKSLQRTDHLQFARLSEEFARHVRFANKFIGLALFGMAVIGGLTIAMLWPAHKVPSQIETRSTLPPGETPKEDAPGRLASNSKLPFPLPTSFGIYVLSDHTLTELETLPISIPDPRIALSAEMRKPSGTTISDSKPSFILFRRDFANSAPEKITLRVIARMARETKIVGGKAKTANIEGTWRIRNISRELKISPIADQREMVIARLGDDVSLAPGRYALVLDRTGYDFTIAGPSQSAAFCLEEFETVDGSTFTQCRTP